MRSTRTTSSWTSSGATEDGPELLGRDKLIARVGARAGVSFTAHVLRHSCVICTCSKLSQLNVIRSRLGHVSITTTSEYIEIDMEMKRPAIERCPAVVPTE